MRRGRDAGPRLIRHPRRGGGPRPAMDAAPRKGRDVPLRRIVIGFTSAGILLVVAAWLTSCGGSTPEAPGPATPTATTTAPSAAGALPTPCGGSCVPLPKKRHTVTYVVTGSPADVTFGPSGSNFSGTVPMRVTKPLRAPLYYAITAQLQGGGQVACKILVDGKTIAHSTATGAYNIAQCEISLNPLTGKWADAND